MNRQEIARKRRRITVEAMLEIEVEREAILRERLEELIGDADAWKLDSVLVPGLLADELVLWSAMLQAKVAAWADEIRRKHGAT